MMVAGRPMCGAKKLLMIRPNIWKRCTERHGHLSTLFVQPRMKSQILPMLLCTWFRNAGLASGTPKMGSQRGPRIRNKLMVAFKRAERELAIRRGMNFIYGIARKPRHFAKCSDDLLYFFYHVALTARDRKLRKMARDMGKESFSRWRNNYQTLPRN